MSTEQVVRSSCGLCRCGCGVLLYLKDGKLTRVEGDPDNPVNGGVICPIGSASLEYLNSPDRLKHPLKRAGERGEGKWQPVSWDEALNVVAGELNKAKDSYGAESVVVIRSAARGLPDDYILRFANAFGTPNFSSPWYVCHTPTVAACQFTCGGYRTPDYNGLPACIILWGSDIKQTDTPKYIRARAALDNSAKLIVINPVPIDSTEAADIWLRLRPGSDLALALGMINVIVSESLYDEAFVENWTVGFDQLKAHVQDYPPEKVADITWVDADKIREAARFYAQNKPACIEKGNALETNVNGFQTIRAICILQAITGNLDIPGGDVEPRTEATPGFTTRNIAEFTLRNKITADMRKQWISLENKLLPVLSASLPQSITRSVFQGDPYPIRAAYIQGSNLLLNWGNAQETYEALKRLDFIAVADMFMTPTAAMADIALPVASYLEYDSVVFMPTFQILRVQQKVAEIGECWSDFKILGELARKLGLGKYFWDDEEQFLDEVLKPTGMTFNEFREIAVIPSIQQYRSYQEEGFKTPSGKVELYSDRLKEWGFDPLPVYYEQPETPYSDPELAREYPLILTSSKSAYYRHSSGRQIGSLRDSHPDPVVEIHPETARQLGIKEGDWAYIETRRGRIKQKARLSTGIDPRVVHADWGWWFPEKGAEDLYGWAESNINVLTDNKPPYSREIGSTNLRGFLCKVYKAA